MRIVNLICFVGTVAFWLALCSLDRAVWGTLSSEVGLDSLLSHCLFPLGRINGYRRSFVLGVTSETQGQLVGTMRYVRGTDSSVWVKVYFKNGRPPGKLPLPKQFQKCSNSVAVIDQKEIFF